MRIDTERTSEHTQLKNSLNLLEVRTLTDTIRADTHIIFFLIRKLP